MLASELIDKVLKEAGLQEARFGGDYDDVGGGYFVMPNSI